MLKMYFFFLKHRGGSLGLGMNRLHHSLIGDLGNLLDLFIRACGSAYVKWW